MNVVLEEQPNECEVTLHVEVPAERVDAERKTVSDGFVQQAKLPGYRPGKAPRRLIEAKYVKEIKEELTSRLLRGTLDEAVRDKDIQVLQVAKIEKADLGTDGTFRFSATVVTSPKFDLPDYSSIEVQLEEPKVDEAELEKTMENIREPHATYEPVEGRGLAMGDYAVVSYQTSLDGTPLKEALPSSPPLLHGRDNFWVEMRGDSFLPGFCEQLTGIEPDGKKTFSIALPKEFPIEELREKSLQFDVTLHAINSKSVPEWSDDLAGRIAPGKTVEELRTMVRENMEQMQKQEFENKKRTAAINSLLEKVEFPLPKRFVHNEMNSVLKDIVSENQGRGVSEEELRQHEDEIMGAAKQSAEQRLRSRFLLTQIAEKEKLEVAEQELLTRVMEMASRYQIPLKKLVRDLQKRNAIAPLREQILAGKALDLIASNVVIRPPAK